MMLAHSGSKLPIFVLLVIGSLTASTSRLVAQAQCSTTLECAQRAVDVAARADAAIQALQGRVDALEKALKTFDRFVMVQPPLTHDRAEALCPANSRIVSASCVGNSGTPQAAVGPIFDFNAPGKATCFRYGNAPMPVQATAVCLKIN
jgi:hypothetical protein